MTREEIAEQVKEKYGIKPPDQWAYAPATSSSIAAWDAYEICYRALIDAEVRLAERESLRKKLVWAGTLLNDWGLTFNWKAWRTDTKHVTDAHVSELVDKTCGREWDQDFDEYALVTHDYLADVGGRIMALEKRYSDSAERVKELREALQGVIAWEQEYRQLNHLGNRAPHPFERARAVLSEEGKCPKC